MELKAKERVDGFDQKGLKGWFQRRKRDFPWRQNPTPYAVWISEVMLQQTRAAVVVPYFERWMQRFPTVESLASASLEEVIKMWEGLGYYSRARNLHAAAQYLVENHGGELPADPDALAKIKGLGPYTVGAILSFAFKRKIPAVDGNVLRVLARYFLVYEDLAKPKTTAKIRQLAEAVLPDEEPWVFNEALIELGATVCGRKPKCYECPLNASCGAYREGEEESLPYKSTKQVIEKLHRTVLIITNDQQLLIRKVPSGKVMSDLHEFPYFENSSLQQSQKHVKKNWQMDIFLEQELPEVQHSFTRYQAYLQPFLFTVKTTQPIKDHIWMPFDQIGALPFSSGHRRILHLLQNRRLL